MGQDRLGSLTWLCRAAGRSQIIKRPISLQKAAHHYSCLLWISRNIRSCVEFYSCCVTAENRLKYCCPDLFIKIPDIVDSGLFTFLSGCCHLSPPWRSHSNPPPGCTPPWFEPHWWQVGGWWKWEGRSCSWASAHTDNRPPPAPAAPGSTCQEKQLVLALKKHSVLSILSWGF